MVLLQVWGTLLGTPLSRYPRHGTCPYVLGLIQLPLLAFVPRCQGSRSTAQELEPTGTGGLLSCGHPHGGGRTASRRPGLRIQVLPLQAHFLQDTMNWSGATVDLRTFGAAWSRQTISLCCKADEADVKALTSHSALFLLGHAPFVRTSQERRPSWQMPHVVQTQTQHLPQDLCCSGGLHPGQKHRRSSLQ